ncbi:RHS repeat-associated core domain-containing protein [Chryseobacterium vrystaatense]|uniref:RHS repeat-associated core domain-containing protein n=1 Tax=Chryseobacterium vrystaatense TaxID=307480 RepID=A0A1M4ZDN3_9FLAO|nr:RHS repeat-associated core domain-containing protein [Chryseobacterium vrystaatense]
MDGFQYENGTLKFFPTAEGYFNFETGKYVYNYTDHLGNTRLSYFKNGSGAEIIEESNYYPFGLKHEGYNVLSGNPAYKYKYNGKELQESGMYDYGTRFYMPEIGRWGVIDSAAEYFPEIAPYAYVVNDPIGYIDNDGEMPGPVGAIIGVFSDYITQVGVNYFLEGKNFRTSLTDISGWSLFISGASGFATGGISALTKAATSGIGKQALVKTIDFGIDVLVGTIENAATDYAEKGEFDIWKSITGGLLEAGIGKFIPLKYVDKLENKLARKMNISAEKMTRYKNRMQNDSNRSRSTRARNNRKYAENKSAYEKYTKAYTGVKIVNDAYKAFGAEALQKIDLFKKTPEETKKPTVTVGEIKGDIIRE